MSTAPSEFPPTDRTYLLERSSGAIAPSIGHLPSFFFVIKGIFHLLFHPHLYPPVAKRIPGLAVLSVAVLTFLFTFAYLPQVAFLHFFNGPLAWFNAAIMVLNEAAAIIGFFAEAFLVEEGVVDLFDAVLIDHGLAELVSSARELNWNGRTAIEKLGKFTKAPYARFSCRLTCEFLVLLPVNFIPVIGPTLFIVLQGYHTGALAHYRYFQLKGLRKVERKRYVRYRWFSYLTFGALHLTLQLIPLLSIFFLFTSAVGAALWAVQIEMRDREVPSFAPAAVKPSCQNCNSASVPCLQSQSDRSHSSLHMPCCSHDSGVFPSPPSSSSHVRKSSGYVVL